MTSTAKHEFASAFKKFVEHLTEEDFRVWFPLTADNASNIMTMVRW